MVIILEKYWHKTVDGYVQLKADEEITAYNDMCSINKEIAIDREEKKRTNRDTERTRTVARKYTTRQRQRQ